eukprot:6316972-Prymnesium_polylepis.1
MRRDRAVRVWQQGVRVGVRQEPAGGRTHVDDGANAVSEHGHCVRRRGSIHGNAGLRAAVQVVRRRRTIDGGRPIVKACARGVGGLRPGHAECGRPSARSARHIPTKDVVQERGILGTVET